MFLCSIPIIFLSNLPRASPLSPMQTISSSSMFAFISSLMSLPLNNYLYILLFICYFFCFLEFFEFVYVYLLCISAPTLKMDYEIILMKSCSLIIGIPSCFAFLFFDELLSVSLLIRYEVLAETEPDTLPPIDSITLTNSSRFL